MTEYKNIAVRVHISQYEEIDEVANEHINGILNRSDFARRAFASYLDAVRIDQSKGRGRPRLSVTDRVATKREERRQNDLVNKEAALAEQHEVCGLLDGTIREADGVKYCSWKRYEQMGPQVSEGELEVPFDMLTRQHVRDQFSPNRTAVEAVLAKQKK